MEHPHKAPCHLPAMDEEELYDLADLFKIFGDSTRLGILFTLVGGERSVSEIAESLSMTLPAISHQLRTLKQARLVKTRRDGKNIFYSLDDDHVAGILEAGMAHILE